MAEEVINNNLTDNTANVSTVNQAQSAITNQENTMGATTTAAQNVIGNYSQTAMTDGVDMTGFKTDKFNTYAQQMGSMYNQQFQNTQAQYNQAYQQNVDSYNQQKDEGVKAYQQQANQYGAQSAISNRNNNMYNQYNGVNTGSASQQALSNSNAYNAGMNQIQTARADFESNVAKAIADMEMTYRTNLATALSEGQFELAQQIYSLMQNEDTYRSQLAQEWAANGDFSLLEELGEYSPTAIDNMKLQYGLSGGANSQAILEDLINRGVVSAEYVYNMTGMALCGYQPPVYYVSTEDGTGNESGNNTGTGTGVSENTIDGTINTTDYSTYNEQGGIKSSYGTNGINTNTVASAQKKAVADMTSKTGPTTTASSAVKGSISDKTSKQSGKLGTSALLTTNAKTATHTSKEQATANNNTRRENIASKIAGMVDTDSGNPVGKTTTEAVSKANNALTTSGTDERNYFSNEKEVTGAPSANKILANNLANFASTTLGVSGDAAKTIYDTAKQQLDTFGGITRDLVQYNPSYSNADEITKARVDAEYDAISTFCSDLTGSEEQFACATDAMKSIIGTEGWTKKALDSVTNTDFVENVVMQIVKNPKLIAEDISNGMGFSSSDVKMWSDCGMVFWDSALDEYGKTTETYAPLYEYKDRNGEAITSADIRSLLGTSMSTSPTEAKKNSKYIKHKYGISSSDVETIKTLYTKLKAEAKNLGALKWNSEIKSVDINTNSILFSANGEDAYNDLNILASTHPQAYTMAVCATLSNMYYGPIANVTGIESKNGEAYSQDIYEALMKDHYAKNQLKSGDGTDTRLGNFMRESSRFINFMHENADVEEAVGYDIIRGGWMGLQNQEQFGDSIWGYSDLGVSNLLRAIGAINEGGGLTMKVAPQTALDNAGKKAAEYEAQLDANKQIVNGKDVTQLGIWDAAVTGASSAASWLYSPIRSSVVTTGSEEEKAAQDIADQEYVNALGRYIGVTTNGDNNPTGINGVDGMETQQLWGDILSGKYTGADLQNALTYALTGNGTNPNASNSEFTDEELDAYAKTVPPESYYDERVAARSRTYGSDTLTAEDEKALEEYRNAQNTYRPESDFVDKPVAYGNDTITADDERALEKYGKSLNAHDYLVKEYSYDATEDKTWEGERVARTTRRNERMSGSNTSTYKPSSPSSLADTYDKENYLTSAEMAKAKVNEQLERDAKSAYERFVSTYGEPTKTTTAQDTYLQNMAYDIKYGSGKNVSQYRRMLYDSGMTEAQIEKILEDVYGIRR